MGGNELIASFTASAPLLLLLSIYPLNHREFHSFRLSSPMKINSYHIKRFYSPSPSLSPLSDVASRTSDRETVSSNNVVGSLEESKRNPSLLIPHICLVVLEKGSSCEDVFCLVSGRRSHSQLVVSFKVYVACPSHLTFLWEV